MKTLALFFALLFVTTAGYGQTPSTRQSTAFQYAGQLLDGSGSPVTSGSYSMRAYVWDGTTCYLFGRTYTVSPDSNGKLVLDIADSNTGYISGGVAGFNSLSVATQSGQLPACFNADASVNGSLPGNARKLKIMIYDTSITTWSTIDDQLLSPFYEAVNAQKLGGVTFSSGADANKLYAVNTAGNGNELKSISGGSGILVTPSAGAIAISADISTFPNIPTALIASGTLGASVMLPVANILGTLGVAQLPSLTFSNLNGSIAVGQIPPLDASVVTTGSFAVSQIPLIPASYLASGTLNSAQIGIVQPGNGGLGFSAAGANNGFFPIGNGTGFTLGSLNIGAGITQTLAAGSITLDANWSTSATANKIVMRDGSGYIDGALIKGDGFYLRNGGTGIGLSAPATANYSIVLPNFAPSNGHILKSTGGSNTTWDYPIELQTQNANLVFAGPTSGGANTPSFRSLVVADIPALDVTQITTGSFSIARGGTGANNAATARNNLGAAQSGANSDITSLSGLTTALSLAQGGTGQNNTANPGGIVYSGPSSMAITSAGQTGQVLVSQGASAPIWSPFAEADAYYHTLLFEDFLTVPSQSLSAATTFPLGKAMMISTAGGGSMIPIGVAGRPGVLRQSSGTGSSGSVLGFCGSSGAGSLTPTVSFQNGDKWAFEASVAVSSISLTGALWVGLMASIPTATTTQSGSNSGLYFEHLTGTTISPYARGTATYAGTAPSIMAISTYFKYKIVFDGTTATFFINGTQYGSTSTATNIPTGTMLCPGVFQKGTGTSRNLEVDYIGWSHYLPSRL